MGERLDQCGICSHDAVRTETGYIQCVRGECSNKPKIYYGSLAWNAAQAEHRSPQERLIRAVGTILNEYDAGQIPTPSQFDLKSQIETIRDALRQMGRAG